MDISSLVASEKEVNILHPVTKEPVGLVVTVLPKTAPAVERVRRELTNERLSKGSSSPTTVEDLEEAAKRLLIASISDWRWENGADFQGKEIECTPSNIELLTTRLPWVLEQIDKEIGDSASFFKV